MLDAWSSWGHRVLKSHLSSPMGILRDVTFRMGKRPVGGRATEEVWMKRCPDCKWMWQCMHTWWLYCAVPLGYQAASWFLTHLMLKHWLWTHWFVAHWLLPHLLLTLRMSTLCAPLSHIKKGTNLRVHAHGFIVLSELHAKLAAPWTSSPTITWPTLDLESTSSFSIRIKISMVWVFNLTRASFKHSHGVCGQVTN